MHKSNWKRMDTASNIFLSTQTAQDTKVFRFSVAMRDMVDREILNEALRLAYNNFPLYHYTIRGGAFWHYLEESELKPELYEDNLPPCAEIFSPDKRSLLFRVNFFRKRINLEVFHALSDAGGAFKFLKLILFFYCKEKYPESSIPELKFMSEEEYMKDGFYNNFSYLKSSIFNQKIGEAVGTSKTQSVYHIKGTRTEDLRMNVLEVLIKVQDILRLSKEYGASVSVFTTALFMYSAYKDAPVRDEITISASVPIDLRRIFKTESARNFFSTMIVSHTFKKDEGIEEVINSVKEQFKINTLPEMIVEKQKNIINYEKSFLIKIVPRGIKDLVLRYINHKANKKITLATSSMGILEMKGYEDFINHISLMVSAVRPQFVSATYNDIFSICFTTPFRETSIFAKYVNFLKDRGVEIKIYSNNIGNVEEEENEGM